MRQFRLCEARFAAALLISSLATLPVSAQQSDRATVLILDASGSMWGRLADGTPKIEVAREVLGGFFASRDPALPLGVIAYGHNRKGDCSDIEVIAPVGPQAAEALSARMRGISPRGKTPLGQSLRLAAEQIPQTAEAADIVLVTDGLETCGVDPCAVAAGLAAGGIEIRAHVVGFGLTEAEAQGLACVPDQTGGLLLRPQSGAELSEALARVAVEAPPAVAAGIRLIFSYPGAMPETYAWALRNDETGAETALGEVGGAARYQPFAVDLPAGSYTAIVTARAGRGEAAFTVTDAAQDVVVVMQGILPVTVLRDRGPYAAIGETVLFDLNITQAGQEAGGAALTLQLYPAGGGESLTYATVDGGEGPRAAGINLPDRPGPYLLRLETWGGEVLEELAIATESDPAVSLSAPPAVAPGDEIAVESRGSQLASDRIEIWQGETRIDWGLTLGDFQYGARLTAPQEPGLYDLVYFGPDSWGEQVEKARMSIEVGTVADDATGDILGDATGEALAEASGSGHGPDGESDGRPWESYPYRCLPGDRPNTICEVTDPATGLSFMLPEGWVADQPRDVPMTAGAAAAGDRALPFAEFWQTGGNLNRLVLNPHQWLAENGPCVVTRAGQLCLWTNDTAPDDPEALAALVHLQAWLTTGQVIRRCADRPCLFDHPRAGLIGRMPALWSVEMPRALPDGRLATWFFDRDRAGNFKLVGLNQEGGENCQEVRPGMLCEFTPYISSEELDLIGKTLMPRGGLTRGIELDQDSFRRLDTILKGQ